MKGGYDVVEGGYGFHERRMCLLLKAVMVVVRGEYMLWEALLFVCAERRICMGANKGRGKLGLISPMSVHGTMVAENFVQLRQIWSSMEYFGQWGA